MPFFTVTFLEKIRALLEREGGGVAVGRVIRSSLHSPIYGKSPFNIPTFITPVTAGKAL